MKHLLLPAVFFSVLCTSCLREKDTAFTPKGNQKISFSLPVASSITRSVNGKEYEADTPYDPNERFTIFGVKYPKGNYQGWGNSTPEYEGEIAAYNQAINGWDTPIPHFWEAGQSYAFGAYSPSDCALGSPKYTAQGFQLTSYTVPSNLNEQYDLMYAKRIYNKTAIESPYPEEGMPTYNGITLVFRHALASVHFKVNIHEKNPQGTPSISIQSIEINGIKNTGSFNENVIDDASGYKTSNDEDLASGTGIMNWDTECSAANCTYDFFKGDQTLESTQAQDLTELNGAFGFVIPQALTDAATVTIQWTLGQTAKTTSFKLNGEGIPTITEAWKQGRRYTYHISFTADRIYFNPTVEDLTDEFSTMELTPILP